MWDNFEKVGGLSFLPRADHVYQQAPFEAVSASEVEELRGSMPEILWKDFRESDDATSGAQERACVAGACALS